MKAILLLGCALLAFFGGSERLLAETTSAGSGQLVAADARIRSLLPTKTTTAGFLTLNNRSSSDEKLVKVEAEGVGSIEIHAHIHEGGMMKMRQVSSLLVSANSSVSLQPGGYHLMLFKVGAGFDPGQSVVLQLTFESGFQMDVTANVISVLQE